mmetsp:Transcript_6586/g.20573  ORF Transcript_6586/g.20573 Transcript_6586/m.20573 type:complete len:127 (-) Transcript_6586:136-516(-)
MARTSDYTYTCKAPGHGSSSRLQARASKAEDESLGLRWLAVLELVRRQPNTLSVVNIIPGSSQLSMERADASLSFPFPGHSAVGGPLPTGSSRRRSGRAPPESIKTPSPSRHKAHGLCHTNHDSHA